MRRFLALALLVAGCAHREPLPPVTQPLTPTPDAPFRARAPEVSVALPAMPMVRTAELENGLQLWVVERPELPLVSLSFTSRAARDDGTPGGRGLAVLTAALLDEGTRLPDGTVLRHLHAGGSRPSITVSTEGTSVTLNALSAQLQTQLGMLAGIVRRPAMEPGGLEAARRDGMNARFVQSLNGMYQLHDAALTALMGPSHPPVWAPLGNADNLRLFTLASTKRFYEERYAPESSALVVAGAVKLEEVERLARVTFGNWPRSTSPKAPPAHRIEYVRKAQRIHGIEGAPGQAYFSLALPCPPASDARGADFDLIAMLLANLSGSRSTKLLRHEQGISYGIGARCEQYTGYGTFWIDFAVETERGGEALATVLDEIARLRKTAVTTRELAAAKMRLTGQIAGRVSTNAGVVRGLAECFMRGLPADELSTWVQRIEVATPGQLRESAARYFNGRIGIAAWGQRALLEPSLERFGGADWWVLAPNEGD